MESGTCFLLLSIPHVTRVANREISSPMLTYVCPHCRESLTIPERFAGQAGQCKKCGGNIIVPVITPPPSACIDTPKPSRARGDTILTPAFQSPMIAPLGMSTARKIAYGLAIAAMAGFCIVIFVQGVLPRAQSFSKALNLALPLLFLILGVAGLFILGRLLRGNLSKAIRDGQRGLENAGWLIWGDLDNLDCPFCGESAHVNALFSIPDLDIVVAVETPLPGKFKEYTCGKCGAQFPFRYAPRSKSRANDACIRLVEWSPRPPPRRTPPQR